MKSVPTGGHEPAGEFGGMPFSELTPELAEHTDPFARLISHRVPCSGRRPPTP
jgi:hypothetical protein